MIRIIVSDTALGDHANAVKAAISLGYGSDISDQIEIKTGGLSADLAYADLIGAIAVVRSTTGYSGYNSTALAYYPDIQVFMPLGSNNNIELTTSLSCIVSSGAGDAEGKNNTAYGNGLEFWDNDYDTTTAADVSSYSNGVVAGKLLKIKDTLNCSWWEARYRARMTADRTEDNRPADTEWHKYNGYGKINVSSAVAYSSSIIDNPYITATPEITPIQQDQTLNNSVMISQTFNIDLTETTECIIRLYKGDTHTVYLNVKNDGVAFDMSAYTPLLTAMLDETGTTADIQLYGADIVTTNAATGQLVFTFSPSDTENETAGTYYYDIQITNGGITYTILKSTLELIQDVTKGTSVSTKYKVYTALLTQTGTSAPTATVLENTLSGTVVWTYDTVGVYLGTLSAAFTANKTAIFLSSNQSDNFDYIVTSFRSNANAVQVWTFDATSMATDAVLNETVIEIRVYN